MNLKITSIFTLIFCLQASASVFPQTVTLNKKAIRLEEVFARIEQGSNYVVTYKKEDIKRMAPMDIQVRNMPLTDFMRYLLEGKDMEFSIEDRTIMIFSTPKGKKKPVQVSSVEILQQKAEGQVVNDKGQPVAGATVNEVGTTNSVSTDADGRFKLTLKSANAVLSVNMIGYQEVRIAAEQIGSKSIVLQEKMNDLEDVVVVGYGTQKKSAVTAAISRVTSDDLDLGNPTNVQNALKGKVSGVQIISESGQPGAASKIRIRGTGTVNDAGPLYIVDGVPSYNGINYLNPSDIESIDVLKDAASAAIYGARGANGVILVTTKKGTKGADTRLNYEFTQGWQNAERKAGLLSSKDYQMLMNEMAANSGRAPYFTTPSQVNTDWFDVLAYKDAPISNHKVNITGGGDKSTYYLSYGNLKQSGILAKGYADYERNNVRLNYSTILMDKKDRDWLNNLTVNSIVNYTKEKRVGTDIGNSEASGLIASINMLPPTESVYQDDPEMLKKYGVNFPKYIVDKNGRAFNIIDLNEINNPLASMQVNNNQVRNPQFFGSNISADLSILPGLKLRSALGTDWAFNSRRKVTPEYNLNTTHRNVNSYVEDLKSDSKFWQWENVLSYNKKFGAHQFNVLAGTTLSSYEYSDLSGTDYDLLVVDINKAYIDIATGDRANERINGGGYQHKLTSVFGRLSYNYKEKYLLEGVVRRDGSSNFGPKHQFAVFPSLSLGWVLTQENFMIDRPDWLTFLKLRASWGLNGNEAIGAFGYTSNMALGYNAVVGGNVVPGAKTSGYVNEDLKWETSEQTDIGMDLTLFGGKFNFTVDYFNKTTRDMLLWMQLPEYTGFRSMRMNFGSVSNKGVELEAGYKFQVNDFKFRTNANASYVKNVVTNIGPERVGLNIIGGGLGGTVTWMETGKPYGFFYGYVHDGLFQNQSEVDAYRNPSTGNLLQPNAKPGDVRFKDLNGDGVLDGNDRMMLGKPNPDWTFGFNLSAEWKNFDVQAFFQGVAGNQIYKFYRRANITQANWDESWLDRWHGEGTSNWMPRVVEGDPNHNTSWVSNLFIEKGDYLRMKVLQLGYQLPESVTKKILVQRLRIFGQAENLLTWTKYTGYDPEVGTRNGFDGGTYPQARIWTIGAHVTF